MHRAILIQCLPSIIALGVSFAALALLVRFGGAKLNLGRLRELHRCQDGGVQSLSFVLTLPVFLMFVLLIVQVSQLMIGIVTVNYAAFAAARSAAVWIPANVIDPASPALLQETQNRFHANLPLDVSDANQRLILIPFDSSVSAQRESSDLSYKYSRIRTAAVLGCAPICPSRDVGFTSSDISQASREAALATQAVYGQIVPGSANNARIATRIENKIRYADRNTAVFVEWRDALPGTNTLVGPTYNPVGHPMAVGDYNSYDRYAYKPWEVGWQDPVTVYVIHRFALFPGPGRWLDDLLVRRIGVPARVRAQIPAEWQASYIAESETYCTPIAAAATLPAEGVKSSRPYVYETY